VTGQFECSRRAMYELGNATVAAASSRAAASVGCVQREMLFGIRLIDDGNFASSGMHKGSSQNTKGDDAAPVASSPSVIVVALSVASLSLTMIGGAPVPPTTA
jgi:hypothetical protein